MKRAAQGVGSPEPAASTLETDVVRLTGTVRPDGFLRVRARVANRGEEQRAGLRLVATMHQRTGPRFEYQQAVDNGVLEQTAGDLGIARSVGLEGVYPLRLRLLEGDRVAAADIVRASS